MYLDSTRYKAVQESPEKYRITYECNLVPDKRSLELDDGTSMHEFMDVCAKGLPDTVAESNLREQGVPPQSIEQGRYLANALDLHLEGDILASEQEFRYEIPGSPHGMVGKIDRIMRINGVLKILDFKSAAAHKKLDQVQENWKSDVQADFYFIGARQLGYDVQEMELRYALKTVPVRTWQPIVVRRTERQLELIQRYVHIWCETIEFWRATFGIQEPWPHNSDNYFCKTEGKWACSYKDMCQTSIVPGCGFPGMKTRIDHLKIMRGEHGNG
jgi:hypothetical protein